MNHNAVKKSPSMKDLEALKDVEKIQEESKIANKQVATLTEANEALQVDIESLKATKGTLEVEKKDLEDSIVELNEVHEKNIAVIVAKHSAEITKLKKGSK